MKIGKETAIAMSAFILLTGAAVGLRVSRMDHTEYDASVSGRNVIGAAISCDGASAVAQYKSGSDGAVMGPDGPPSLRWSRPQRHMVIQVKAGEGGTRCGVLLEFAP
jgi:hypothetical protein